MNVDCQEVQTPQLNQYQASTYMTISTRALNSCVQQYKHLGMKLSTLYMYVLKLEI